MEGRKFGGMPREIERIEPRDNRASGAQPRRYAGPSLSLSLSFSLSLSLCSETRKGQPRRKGLRRRSTLPYPLPFLANRSAVLLRPLLGLP